MNEQVTTPQQLREILGTPSDAARNKQRDALTPLDVQWLAHAPFVLLATSDAEGRCDVSPKGDRADGDRAEGDAGGIALVLDEHTLAIPERPGNRRADGYLNMLANPHVGLLFVIPGRGDTLRVNGRATIVRDAPWFDRMVVKGHRPILAVVVDVEEVFHHCQKAFLRSGLWDPDTWDPEAVPSRAVIAQALERPDETVEALEAYYGPSYAEGLYRA